MEAFKNDIQNGEFLNKKKEIQKEQERIRREKERALQEEQGNPAAQTSLGALYRDGLGVEQSDEKAIEWFTKAAEQGDEDAKSCLEEMN